MGGLISTLAFPAPPKDYSQAALFLRATKNQLLYLTTKSGLRIPAIHIQNQNP